MVPTILVWIGLVLVVHTITQNRYTTYALSLAVLAFTGYRLLTNQINWVGNWPLWSAVRWSDISVFEFDRKALYLSRLFAVSLAMFLAAASDAFAAATGTRPALFISSALAHCFSRHGG